jgi:hypothetical protein
MANISQSLFERGMKVLVEGASSATPGPATIVVRRNDIAATARAMAEVLEEMP